MLFSSKKALLLNSKFIQITLFGLKIYHLATLSTAPRQQQKMEVFVSMI
jgi:hypothetical protein